MSEDIVPMTPAEEHTIVTRLVNAFWRSLVTEFEDADVDPGMIVVLVGTFNAEDPLYVTGNMPDDAVEAFLRASLRMRKRQREAADFVSGPLEVE